MKPHKHAEIIKAWADGADIQMQVGPPANLTWVDVCHPRWNHDSKYRVKPAVYVYYAEIRPGVANYYLSRKNLANLKLTFSDNWTLLAAEVLK